MPGIPGPGIVTIMLGIMLLHFPGKRRLERWLIRRPLVLSAMNRLRQRYGKPPMVIERARRSMSHEASPHHACEATHTLDTRGNGSLTQRGRR